MKLNIILNTIIEWKENEFKERILWMDQSRIDVISINIDDPNALPVIKKYADIQKALENGEVAKISVNPFSSLFIPDNDILQEYREHRDTAWRIIEDLVRQEPDIYVAEKRGKLIQEAVKKFGISKITIYKYLRRYWQRGKIKNALLPDFNKCGAPGKTRIASETGITRGRKPTIIKTVKGVETGMNITEEWLERFRQNIFANYYNEKKLSLKKVYEIMVEEAKNEYEYKKEGSQEDLEPLKVPTLGQFSYWYYRIIREESYPESIILREGMKTWNLKHKPVWGNATEKAFGPGSVIEIDSTPVDIHLVNSNNRTITIIRATKYTALDVFSRMIVGIHIGTEPPSWNSARKVLYNMMTDKVAFCAKYGITITEEQWPSHHVPRSIFTDRGELKGKQAGNLTQLDITVSTAPPYHPDFKPFVERGFKKFNDELTHRLRGSIKKVRERGDPDPRKQATYSLYEYTQLVIYTVLKFNMGTIKRYPASAAMIGDGLVYTPLNLWEWGLDNRSGDLREETPDVIRLSLLPQREVTVEKKGIRLEKDMYYVCDSLISNNTFSKVRTGKTLKVTVLYDPEDVREVYLKHVSGQLERCTITSFSKKYNNYNLEEIKGTQYQEAVKTEEYQSKTQLDKDAIDAEIDKIIKKGEKETLLAIKAKNIGTKPQQQGKNNPNFSKSPNVIPIPINKVGSTFVPREQRNINAMNEIRKKKSEEKKS